MCVACQSSEKCMKFMSVFNQLDAQNLFHNKLVKYWDKYTEMYGQQNVKKNVRSFDQSTCNIKEIDLSNFPYFIRKIYCN